MGYDVSYQTDVDTQRDPNSLLQHRLVLDNGHDEYWTKEMFDAFDGARPGDDLAFMGANDAYWQVLANAIDDLSRPAPPSAATATETRSGVVLSASLHTDPRVTGFRFMRSSLGGAVACSGSTGCVDHPPGHHAYTYQAVAADPWGVSLPAAAGAVRVPNTPPSLVLRRPRAVEAGSVRTYRAVVADADGDAVIGSVARRTKRPKAGDRA